METGKLHIYMGEGKGKTTAAVGLAVRCAGAGYPVMFAQFLKPGTSGELNAFEDMDHMQVIPSPSVGGFTWEMTDDEKEMAKEAYEQYLNVISMRIYQGKCKMLVMDEIIGACSAGLVAWEELIDFLDSIPEEIEVVLTGRYPSQELIDRADYVTEMKKIKHPFDKGLRARKGIEF